MTQYRQKPKVVMVLALPSIVAPEDVAMITDGAASDSEMTWQLSIFSDSLYPE